MEPLINLLGSTWDVLTQMAPYLLLGFLISGVLYLFMPAQWIEKHLGGRGYRPILLASLIGVPLPLCSCSVIPVTASIRKHGASPSATTAFLLSTPQTGVDSILATYALLGPIMAVFRPLIAFSTGVLGGIAVSWLGERETEETNGLAVKPTCTDGCCDTQTPLESRVLAALRHGFITLPRDLAKPLLFGIVIAGLITALAGQDFLAAYLGGGLFSMLIMMAVGLPLYVCSTASIPLAVGFMHLGASPGAALVFLITGPATNAATISVILKLMGRRVMTIYIMTVIFTALASGYLLDAFWKLPVESNLAALHAHHDEVSAIDWFSHASAVLLLAILVCALLGKRNVRTTAISANAESLEGKPMETLILKVTGMTCGHCANSVARALQQFPGIVEVTVDLAAGEARVTGASLAVADMTQAIHDLGYKAEASKA